MKKLLSLLTLICFLLPGFVYGQGSGRGYERIRSVKIAFITQRLNLTPREAESFWPIYNQFEQERTALRASFFKKRTANANTDEASSRRYIDDNLDFQQQQLELRRKYKDAFLKVLSPQQVVALFDAERDFKQMLLQQLKERHGGGGMHRQD